MASVWRFSGNPENWLTAIQLRTWALNENNKSLWENKILPGDTVLFHSTKKSDFTTKAESSIIGFGYVGEGKYIKDEFWWVQEVRDKENYWPYVVPLREIYLFSETEKIDLTISVDKKSDGQIVSEIQILLKKAIPLNELNTRAREVDPQCPAFPVNGSASGVNPIYESLLLDHPEEPISPYKEQDSELYKKKLAEDIDEKLAELEDKVVYAQALAYDDSNKESHTLVAGERKVRRESQLQKRRVAKIEGYTCQVCGFRCAYLKANRKPGWIIEVDHIKDKAEGAGESLNNLWVLCPNCHEKKTRGVITIDVENKKVFERGKEIEIRDHHLWRHA